MITIIHRRGRWYVRIITAHSARSLQTASLAGALLWAQEILEGLEERN